MARAAIVPHLGQISVPQTRTCKVEDSTRFDPAHEVLERALHRSRVRAFPAQPDSLFQEILTKHKICALHVSTLRSPFRTASDLVEVAEGERQYDGLSDSSGDSRRRSAPG